MTSLREFERQALVHMEAAYNLAYWLVRDRDDAQDVVQDAYLRAFRAYDRRTGADIKPWLLTIVRNVAYRWLTVRKRSGNVISFEGALSGRDGEDERVLEVPCEDPSAEDLLISRADQILVHIALAELPPMFREVIVLRELEGLSEAEKAAAFAVYMKDERDTATPRGMTAFLSALATGTLLSPASTRYFLDVMGRTKTFPDRLRAGAPKDWTVGHKTGTSQTLNGVNGVTNDVGILTAPDGGKVAISAFVAESTASNDVRAAIIANAARATVAAYR